MSKTCIVKCLKSLKELHADCKKLGLTVSEIMDEEECETTYEIDFIISDMIEDGRKKFLVKWKNYPLEWNTWEPLSNLVGCSECLSLYYVVKHISKVTVKDVIYFIKDSVHREPKDLLSLKKIVSIFDPNYKIDNLRKNEYNLIKKANSILKLPKEEFEKEKESILDVMIFSHERKPVLVKLKEWEDDINTSADSPYIKVENDVDLETAPDDFQFIHDYMPTSVQITDDPLVSCTCENCFENNECCPANSDAVFAYNQHGAITLRPGFPVYECNKCCPCGPNCPNRVVQHGTKVKVSIFRTSNGRGWGLKTLEDIKKGHFVVEYLGEVIDEAIVDWREKNFSPKSRCYVFDLDLNSGNSSFMVDAGNLGNASHFINHCCEPNMDVYPVWINQLDARLPRLAFFAKRRINSGEELTFDYYGGHRKNKTEPTDKENPIPCLCGSNFCRKFL